MCDGVFDDEADESLVAQVEWKRVNDGIELEGFREGRSEAHDKSLQEGFDYGYNLSFNPFHSLSILRGIIESLNYHVKNAAKPVETEDVGEVVRQSLLSLQKAETLATEEMSQKANDEKPFSFTDDLVNLFNKLKADITNVCNLLQLTNLSETVEQCQLDSS